MIFESYEQISPSIGKTQTIQRLLQIHLPYQLIVTIPHLFKKISLFISTAIQIIDECIPKLILLLSK